MWITIHTYPPTPYFLHSFPQNGNWDFFAVLQTNIKNMVFYLTNYQYIIQLFNTV